MQSNRNPANGAGRLSAFCRWEVPERSTVVELHQSVVDWLTQELTRGRGPAGPAREGGGLLLGKVARDVSTQIIIQSFTPVFLERPAGCVFNLSDADRARLAGELRQWGRRPDRHLYAVGCFRTHERPDFALDSEDSAFVRELGDAGYLFLLIHSAAPFPAPAGFFFPNGGQLEANALIRFPFDLARLRDGLTGAAPAGRPAPPGVRTGNSVPAGLHAPGGASRRWPWAALPAVLAASLGIAVYLAARREGVVVAPPLPMTVPVPERRPEAANLDLRAWMHDGAIDVSWNPRAPQIRLASRGILVVGEGSAQMTLELEPHFLQAGSARGIPAGTAARVSLRLVNGEREVSETVRVGEPGGEQARGSYSPPPSAPESREAGAEPPAVEAYFEPLMPDLKPRRREPEPRGEPLRRARATIAENRAAASRTGYGSPEPLPSQELARQSESGPAGGPERASDPPRTAPLERRAARFGRSPELFILPPDPVLSVAPAPAAASDSAPAAAAPSPAAERTAAPVAIARVPPQPVRRVKPVVPYSLALQLREPIRISVRVRVNAAGEVVSAESLARPGDTLIDFLSRAAVDAARQWRFRPAREGRRPVESETVLDFRFVK